MAFGGVEVEKARGVPAGVATRDVSDIVNAMSKVLQRNRQGGAYDSAAFPRPDAWNDTIFGPGQPFAPSALDQPRTDTGQADPRLWEYPVSWNVQIGRDRHVSWDTLLRASESPLFRACIELRKTEISTLDWAFRVSPVAAARIAHKSGQFEETVSRELRDKYQDEIDRATDFWQVPDRKNGRDFAEWIGLAMDEQLTHDALAIYPHMTYGGDLHGLWVIDGTTVMPLFDETGGRPAQPYPAYQQIMYGFPRGEFTAHAIQQDGQKVVPGGMLASQLIYRRRVPRTKSPYGYSPTEQALLDGLLYNRRFGWMLAEYTEGSMPAQFMESDGSLDWTPMQIREYERWFNDRFAGNTEERMRFPFLPPGLKAAAMAHPGERYRPDYDLHLVKLVAMHFQCTITELGFTEQGGLGSTGYHEGQEDINFRKGRLPDLRWFGNLITAISRTYLKLPPELEFAFLGLDQEDEAAADQIDQNRVASGRMTLNQANAKLGLPPYGFKEADMPMLQTARGVVFFDGASEMAPGGVLIEPASESNEIEGAMSGARVKKPGTAQSPTERRPIASAGGKASKDATYGDKWAEVDKCRKWLAKGGHTRKFQFDLIDLDDAGHFCADLIIEDQVEFAKAGGSGPKASGPDGSSTLSWSPYTHPS